MATSPAARHDAEALVRVWSKRVATFALTMAVVVLGSRAAARRFVFPVQDVRRPALPPDLVERRLLAGDGVPVRALELVGPDAAPVVVHFHNNREAAEASAPVAREIHARGVGVVLAEYRGYGRSTAGEPTESGLYADAEAVLAMLAARGIGPSRIVLWGTSLGTGVAAEMARRGRGRALVLVAPFTSIPDLVTSVVPFVPASALVPDRFETLQKVHAIEVPALVVHGEDDEVVPFAMGARIAGALPNAQLLRVPGGRHGDLFMRDRARILDAIVAIGTHGASSPRP